MLQNQEAELTAIGMALMDPKAAEKLALLPEDTFSYDDTIAAHKGIRKVIEEHGKPDLVTVQNACAELKLNPGTALVSAMRKAVTAANYGQYEAMLLDLRKRRALLLACGEVSAKIADPSNDPDKLMVNVLKVAQDTTTGATSVSFRDSLMQVLTMMDGRKAAGISTGIAGLNTLTGGFRPGQLIYLGARPGVGKTALALFMATYVAEKSGPVLVVSLEMTAEELTARIIAEMASVNVQRIINGQMQEEDYQAIGQITSFGDLPLRFTGAARTPLQIRQEAQAMIRDGGLKLIVVDYLQLMRSDHPVGKRYEDVSNISMELKAMAMDLKVPILALTQFNRSSEGGGGFKKRRPSMAEARDSGSIEQDANIFLTLYAPEEPKQGTWEHECWDYCQSQGTEWQVLLVEKNRNGSCGQVSLSFDKPHMRFSTMTKERGF